MDYQMLGADAAVVNTYSLDELKSIKGYTHVRTGQYRADKNYYMQFGPGTSNYFLYPWNWVDLPRNQLEDKGTIKHIQNHAGNWGVEWNGRAVFFKDHIRYLNTLGLVNRSPEEFIEYLKLAPVAGFNVTGNPPSMALRRDYASNTSGFNPPFIPVLPEKVYTEYWMEVITWDVLQQSFAMLRMSQIEDLPDLFGSYQNAGKYFDKLKSAMRTEVHVDVQPTGFKGQSKGYSVWVGLTDKQIGKLEAGIKELYKLYEENRKKMAERIIQLQDVDAEILPTDFSLDEHQNPYLVFNPERSQQENKPIFTNIARNAPREAGLWNPPEVAGPESQLKYWEQVPGFTAQHERKFISEYGPTSPADIDKYGLDPATKRTNWLPWIVAGGAAAYAATQLM